MRQVFAGAVERWFLWTMPRGLSSETMTDRERLRKARILSIGVFFAFVLGTPLIVVNVLTHSPQLVLILLTYEAAHGLAAWLNRSRHIELACWCYIAHEMRNEI